MKLTSLERRLAITVSGIYGLRMFGLFLVMPVLMVYASDFPDYTPAMAGLAIGIYGLGQAFLQIPLGYLSDRIGRKPVIIFGLLIFALGSYVAAQAESLTVLVLGRALQGAGAIASTLMAFVSDLSRPEVRSKLMASIGATIGLAFVLSMSLGPWLTTLIGVPGLFYLIIALSMLALAVIIFMVPKEQRHNDDAYVLPAKAQMHSVFANQQLQILNFSIFALHLFLTAIFVVVPLQLIKLEQPLESHSIIYLSLMVASFLAMLPLMIWVEKRKQHPLGMRIAVSILLVAMLIILQAQSLWGWILSLGLFFVAFNFLEASIPAMVSRVCGSQQRGTAMGFYSTGQFFGAFLGGLLAGYLLQHAGSLAVFWLLSGLAFVWLVVIWLWFKPLSDSEVTDE